MAVAAAEDLKQLGRYDLTRVLGKGAMGIVYEGLDPKLHRKVAIKTILKGHLDDDEAAKEYSMRFMREAQAVARLNHPHIVQVYDFGEEGEIAYIVMEFIKGKELKNFFDANERFELKEAVRIMCELLDALDFAHEGGIVHRDIKPANVMLDGQARVKLADFGVARVTDDRSAAEKTQAGTMVGTPAYMSPEQITGGNIDRRSDIFSAGIILYQFLTGEKPFTGSGAWTIAKKIIQDHPPVPSSINNTISPLFDAWSTRRSSKSVEQRYQTAKEFGAALKRALEGKSDEDDSDKTVVGSMADLASIAKPVGADGGREGRRHQGHHGHRQPGSRTRVLARDQGRQRPGRLRALRPAVPDRHLRRARQAQDRQAARRRARGNRRQGEGAGEEGSRGSRQARGRGQAEAGRRKGQARSAARGRRKPSTRSAKPRPEAQAASPKRRRARKPMPSARPTWPSARPKPRRVQSPRKRRGSRRSRRRRRKRRPSWRRRKPNTRSAKPRRVRRRRRKRRRGARLEEKAKKEAEARAPRPTPRPRPARRSRPRSSPAQGRNRCAPKKEAEERAKREAEAAKREAEAAKREAELKKKLAEAPKAKMPIGVVVGVILAIAAVGGGAWYYYNKSQLEKQAALTAALETATKASQELQQAQAKQLEVAEGARAGARGGRCGAQVAATRRS